MRRIEHWLVVLATLAIYGIYSSWPADNKSAIFDLSLGVFVSLLIYGLVSWLPEYQKKAALKRFLNNEYCYLLDSLIPQYLNACGEADDPTTVESLKNQEQFKLFFKEKKSETQDRWHAVANGLQQSDIRLLAIVQALENFQYELDICLTLSVVNIERGGFERLRILSQLLVSARRAAAFKDYSGINQLCRFLWSLHTSWNFRSGYADQDQVKASIELL
jgi:hypothetical protein